ncbi:MAG: transporter substrate-binding domain-containing protein [Pseudomonadota bacterium]
MRKRMTLTLLLLAPAGTLLAQERVRITMGEWPPLISAAQPQYGVVGRLVTEIFEAAGLAVDYAFVPWKRAMQQVQDGQAHATAIWGHSPERDAVFDFSEPVFTDELVLYYHKDRPLRWDGSEDDIAALRGVTIGQSLGSAKTPMLERAERRGELHYESSGDEQTNLRKLLLKRIGAVDMSRTSGSYLLQQHFSPAERAHIGHTAPFGHWRYCMMFSRKAPGSARYLALFDQGLRRLKASGRYQQLWDDFQRDLKSATVFSPHN